jgi:hypothetical protein
MKNMMHERKDNRKEGLHNRIFYAARRMNGPDILHKVQISVAP